MANTRFFLVHDLVENHYSVHRDCNPHAGAQNMGCVAVTTSKIAMIRLVEKMGMKRKWFSELK